MSTYEVLVKGRNQNDLLEIEGVSRVSIKDGFAQFLDEHLCLIIMFNVNDVISVGKL